MITSEVCCNPHCCVTKMMNEKDLAYAFIKKICPYMIDFFFD